MDETRVPIILGPSEGPLCWSSPEGTVLRAPAWQREWREGQNVAAQGQPACRWWGARWFWDCCVTSGQLLYLSESQRISYQMRPGGTAPACIFRFRVEKMASR